MMEILKAIFLGIIEGITEFLPVSSTGHLILANEFIHLGSQEFQNLFNVVIQLGAVLAIVVLFWKRLFPFYKSVREQERANTFRLYLLVLVGMLPAFFAWLFLDKYIEQALSSPLITAAMLVVYGIVILLVDKGSRQGTIQSVYDIPFRLALFIGMFQCLAMVPGTSRSAATIIGALLLGIARPAAAEFSFFLALPAMAGASLVTLYKHASALSGNLHLVLVGFVTAFAVALLVVRTFMKLIGRHTFRPFGYYRIALGLLVLGLYAAGVAFVN